MTTTSCQRRGGAFHARCAVALSDCALRRRCQRTSTLRDTWVGPREQNPNARPSRSAPSHGSTTPRRGRPPRATHRYANVTQTSLVRLLNRGWGCLFVECFEKSGTPTLPVRAFIKHLRRRAGPRLIGGEFGRAWRRRSLSVPAEGGLGEVDGKKERVNGASHHYCVCSLIRGTTRSSGNRSRKPSGRLRHGSFRTSRGAPACC